MKSEELKLHVFATYKNVRYGMAAIAAAFPILLCLGGRLQGVDLQDSLSAYYWATLTGYPPMRIWFVGILFVVGVFLYLYKGFSNTENYVLNVAGACAFGVALSPMPWGCGTQCPKVTAHGIFAVSLFICIAFVALKCTQETLHLINDENLKRKYLRTYRVSGLFMVTAPFTAFAMSLWADDINKYVFFIETAAIWAFAFYWWVKSDELAHSGAELLALHEKI